MNLMKKIKHWLSRKNLACEIKLLLDSSQVLGADHQLIKSMQKAFQIEDEPMRIEVIYLDTPERDYLKAGWVSRIRVKEGKPRYTITYKMRYPVPEGDVDAALAAARADGLTLKESPYPAEIDWGYSKMTLSFAANAEVKAEKTPDLSLLLAAKAVQMAVENLPYEVKDQNSDSPEDVKYKDIQVVGPVRFLRYEGALGKQSVRIEVWPVPSENGGIRYTAELSRACKNLMEAAEIRIKLIEKLDKMGILIHSDNLKTQMILKPAK